MFDKFFFLNTEKDFFLILGTFFLYLMFSAVSHLQQTYTDRTSKTSFFRYPLKKRTKF